MMKKTLIALFVSSITVTVAAYANTENFLTISDIHYEQGQAEEPDYAKGDTGDILWRRTQAELQKLVGTEQPKFLVVLGDLPAHDDARRPNNIKAVLQYFSHDAGITAPIFYVPGNNDSLAGDYDSFTDEHGDTPFSLDPDQGWPALNVQKTCANDYSAVACTIDTDTGAQFGYYAARPLGTANKLVFIALNTVIFTPHYVSADGRNQQEVAQAELGWLKQQLSNAARNHDKVILALHVPPGVDGYADPKKGNNTFWDPKTFIVNPTTKEETTYFKEFLQIIFVYHAQVDLLLTGHTHMDEFKRLDFKDAGHTPVAVAISTPGITPGHANSPSMRVFHYDDQTDDIMDYTTYYTTPKTPPSGENIWNSYSFKAGYQSTQGCSATKTVVDCIKGFSMNDTHFQSIFEQDYSGYNPHFTPHAGWGAVFSAIDAVV